MEKECKGVAMSKTAGVRTTMKTILTFKGPFYQGHNDWKK
jgi:hypothetical protein